MKTMVLSIGSCYQLASNLGLWHVDAAIKIELELKQEVYRSSGKRNFTSECYYSPEGNVNTVPIEDVFTNVSEWSPYKKEGWLSKLTVSPLSIHSFLWLASCFAINSGHRHQAIEIELMKQLEKVELGSSLFGFWLDFLLKS